LLRLSFVSFDVLGSWLLLNDMVSVVELHYAFDIGVAFDELLPVLILGIDWSGIWEQRMCR